jgi:phosphoserine phosphatase RsbU/P
MTKAQHFRLKNAMLIGNVISNAVAVFAVFFVIFRPASGLSTQLAELVQRLEWVFDPLSVLLAIVVTILYERPIRRFVNLRFQGKDVPAELDLKARRRVLNEPFFLMAVNFSFWLADAILFSALSLAFSEPWPEILRVFFESFNRGLISTIMAFFVLEWILQKTLSPYLFPEGRLACVPGTIRIRIGIRLAALLFACNLVPFLSILNIIRPTSQPTENPGHVLMQLRSAVFHDILIFMAVGICLTFILGKNLTRPFQSIIATLRKVQEGNYNEKAKVLSSDEIGYTGDVINEMTEGLKERAKMRQALDLAMEIQKSLLPREPPQIAGLDIAAKTIYCDETGGDYYDFLDSPASKVTVIIGDVSGHGISSALLMATARGLLRQRSSMQGDIGQIVSDVNRQLTRDVEDSGHFMTLFYCTIDVQSRTLQWVRAGHDPAILYDPINAGFEELRGPGIALGIDQTWDYQHNEKTALSAGQIIVLGTDGIWETHNSKGEIFGKKPILDILLTESAKSGDSIMQMIIESLNRFRGDSRPEDDVSLVIIKFIG